MRHFHLFAAMAAATALLAACEKNHTIEPAQLDYPQFNAPVTQTHAALYSFTEKNTLGFRSMELTEGGMYVIETEKPLTKAEAGEPGFLTGTYTVSEGTYTLEGIGTVTISDGKDGKKNVSILTDEVETVLAATMSTAVPGSELTAVLCRTWKVDGTKVSVEAEGLPTVTHTFTDGCSLSGILSYFESHGARLGNAAAWEGYDVAHVLFTAQGTAVISFTGAEPYVGSWKWKDEENGILSYSYSVDAKGGSIISGQGEATVTIDGDNLTFEMSGEREKADILFDVKTAFVLSEDK